MSLRRLLAMALIATTLGAAPDRAVVREQRRFTINGVTETWRLVWRGPPIESASCGPADTDTAMTCPCSGVAYAQVGDLVLDRERPGSRNEQLPLSPLFAGSDVTANEKSAVAILPRWPARPSDLEHPPSPAAIRARPTEPVMHLRDYDHDGIAGEFLLQVDTEPCGKHVMVAVGITRDHPHLHALASAEHPERPLRLYQWQWDALARNSRPGEVTDWPCGDHGAERETTMILRADRGLLHATRLTSTCPDTLDAHGNRHHDAHSRRRLLGREVL